MRGVPLGPCELLLLMADNGISQLPHTHVCRSSRRHQPKDIAGSKDPRDAQIFTNDVQMVNSTGSSLLCDTLLSFYY